MLVHVSQSLPIVPPDPAVLPLPAALTTRQLDLLRAVAAYRRTTGSPPSLRDLAEAAGLTSVPGVQHALDVLQGRHCLTRRRNVARGTVLTPLGELLASGWTYGPPTGQDKAVAIDTHMARYMRCGCCLKRGLAYIPLRRSGEYNGVFRCACGWQEGA